MKEVSSSEVASQMFFDYLSKEIGLIFFNTSTGIPFEAGFDVHEHRKWLATKSYLALK